MLAKTGTVGKEWVVDAYGCDPAILRSTETMQTVFSRILAEMHLTPIGDATWHAFPGPGGVTGLVMLTESHLACHTYPEFAIATFNLYCCRERPDWAWSERLVEMLGARTVSVRTLDRGATAAAAHQETRSR